MGIVTLLWAAAMRGGGIDTRQVILFINIPSALFPAMGVIASMLVSYRAADIIRLLKTCRLVRRDKIIIDEKTARDLAQFYDSLGVYSIGWGVIMTVVGLVLVVAYYDGVRSNIFAGLTVAALTIFYGFTAAYLVFFPLSRRFNREWKKP